ncbi:flavin reductase family protein [Shimia sp.]|uniref:flavin reductase family protein n=1 Tax=Shimia sp. TaxID=1954381 RepID=UPI0032976E42
MAPEFDPTAENQRIYRDALGCFATGITIVTAPTPTGPIGMTANSFSSISLDPPLVLWSPAKKSQRYPLFAGADRFAIHVLRADQKDLALEFARRGDAFDQVAWHTNALNVPLIDDCLARFDCQTHAIHDGGDHAIIVGHVVHVTLNDGAPLVFAQRSYGNFQQIS